MIKLQKREIVFYILFFATLGAIFFTYPFLRFPYDMWDHLIAIDNPCLSEVHSSREVWHTFWRSLFSVLSIEPSNIILRARIIHIAQTFLSFFAIYTFGKVAIRHIFKNISPLGTQYMAYWSTLIWFTIFATFSEYYHHIWIMWYSVNYQITLPLFWYILALTIIILLEPHSWKLKLFYGFQIIVISRFILQAHAMEYLYYLMYLSVLFLLYFRELFPLLKRYYYLTIPTLLLLILFLYKYQPDSSQLFNYLRTYHFLDLYGEIINQGSQLVAGGNRASAAVNELMKVALFTGWAMLALLMLRKAKGEDRDINGRMYLFIFITSLFVYIPLFTISAGLASVLTKLEVVNRFYYSSSLFLLLPATLYYFTILVDKKERLLITNILILLSLISTLIYSKHLSSTHNYAKNIHSLRQSFHEREVGFNLSKVQIETIGRLLKQYKANNQDNREILFYARPDIAAILKFVYRENVYWTGRRSYPFLENFKRYILTLDSKQTRGLIFETPEDFPEYTPFK